MDGDLIHGVYVVVDNVNHNDTNIITTSHTHDLFLADVLCKKCFNGLFVLIRDGNLFVFVAKSIFIVSMNKSRIAIVCTNTFLFLRNTNICLVFLERAYFYTS